MGVQYAIKTELAHGRSGRPWREAVLHELRYLNFTLRMLWAKDPEKVDLPIGLDHLPPLDKTPEEVAQLKEEQNLEAQEEDAHESILSLVDAVNRQKRE